MPAAFGVRDTVTGIVKSKRRGYTSLDLVRAVRMVVSGQSVSDAATACGIPRATLFRKLKSQAIDVREHSKQDDAKNRNTRVRQMPEWMKENGVLPSVSGVSISGINQPIDATVSSKTISNSTTVSSSKVPKRPQWMNAELKPNGASDEPIVPDQPVGASNKDVKMTNPIGESTTEPENDRKGET